MRCASARRVNRDGSQHFANEPPLSWVTGAVRSLQHEISAVPPHDYAARFLSFMRKATAPPSEGQSDASVPQIAVTDADLHH